MSIKHHFTSPKLTEFDICDLLGRIPSTFDINNLAKYFNDRVILITGGCGSIGSEICRQVAKCNPKKLIILDICENSAFVFQMEMLREYPNLSISFVIGSVRDQKRLDQIMKQYHPDIVFHAAAHKHVPLMEMNPNEAVKNNVFGTYNTAKSASKYGVKKFVLISTDKAVNPVSVMGASKRICEMIIQMMNRESKTDFIAVRFGNVLDSNGSVIPLFRSQIMLGGPVTVTHPEATRYFMTISEAVSLVLQASCFGCGGDILVLNMGESVRIVDIAKKLILSAGYEPNEDIEIIFTGLRPGEKLHEEYLMEDETLGKINRGLFYITNQIDYNDEILKSRLEELEVKCNMNGENIRNYLKIIVTNYQCN